MSGYRLFRCFAVVALTLTPAAVASPQPASHSWSVVERFPGEIASWLTGRVASRRDAKPSRPVGKCGGAMHATKRTSLRRAPAFYYVCRTHRVRGELICANSFSAPMARLHEAVAHAFKRDVLTHA